MEPPFIVYLRMTDKTKHLHLMVEGKGVFFLDGDPSKWNRKIFAAVKEPFKSMVPSMFVKADKFNKRAIYFKKR
jgi:hypothetical protein